MNSQHQGNVVVFTDILKDVNSGKSWRYDTDNYGYPRFSFNEVVYKTDAHTYIDILKCAKRHNRNDLETLIVEMQREGFVVTQGDFGTHGCAHVFSNGRVHIIKQASRHGIVTRCGKHFPVVPRLGISDDRGFISREKLCKTCFRGVGDEEMFMVYNVKLPKE